MPHDESTGAIMLDFSNEVAAIETSYNELFEESSPGLYVIGDKVPILHEGEEYLTLPDFVPFIYSSAAVSDLYEKKVMGVTDIDYKLLINKATLNGHELLLSDKCSYSLKATSMLVDVCEWIAYDSNPHKHLLRKNLITDDLSTPLVREEVMYYDDVLAPIKNSITLDYRIANKIYDMISNVLESVYDYVSQRPTYIYKITSSETNILIRRTIDVRAYRYAEIEKEISYNLE